MRDEAMDAPTRRVQGMEIGETNNGRLSAAHYSTILTNADIIIKACVFIYYLWQHIVYILWLVAIVFTEYIDL